MAHPPRLSALLLGASLKILRRPCTGILATPASPPFAARQQRPRLTPLGRLALPCFALPSRGPGAFVQWPELVLACRIVVQRLHVFLNCDMLLRQRVFQRSSREHTLYGPFRRNVDFMSTSSAPAPHAAAACCPLCRSPPQSEYATWPACTRSSPGPFPQTAFSVGRACFVQG